MSNTSSLSSSGSGGHSATSISSVISNSNTFTTTSSTITSTISTPSTTTSASQGGDGGKSGNEASASASLYLYTFLATLVLLLSVSAAIILRSLLLRRRHQRMVAEAIRNGTWVPPSPGGSGTFLFGNNGRRVDLTKKPRMWEAFVGSRERHAHLHTQRTGKAETLTEWEWDSIRPFAAAYVDQPSSNDPVSAISSVPPPEHPSVSARMRSLFRRSPRRTPAPIPAEYRTTTATTTLVPVTAPPLGSATPPSTAPAAPAPPQKVRVAVLIAMPQPPEAKSRSPTPQPVASTSTAIIPPPSDIDEEPELPHIEFGVAELDVSLSHTQPDRNKDVRSSVASGSSSSVA
ncbi:hypothetical protein C0995_005142 [Termitomyces sp. Mi166|nr:hypothetical protein C0995_005142 [Termitomyces sp. Mi166\